MHQPETEDPDRVDQNASSDETDQVISRGEGIAVWRQIAEDIASDIRSGKYKSGSRMPTETRLAETYGVNRHTLRRAVSELARLGLVEAAPRRGTFVTASRIDYPIRQQTRFSENVAAAGRDPGGKLLSAIITTAPPEMAAWLAIAEQAEVVQLELIRSANQLPVCWSFMWFPADRFQRLPKAVERFGSITKALEFIGIKNYRRKFTRVSARPAKAKERAMLQLDRGSCILIAESLNVDAHGEPIQASLTLFSAHFVQLTVESDSDA